MWGFKLPIMFARHSLAKMLVLAALCVWMPAALAADKVRIPISSLPYTINTPGSYYLTGNLSGNTGIDVTVDDVTIDLMGFTMSGSAELPDFGIELTGSSSNVTIRNGTIRGFVLAGIYQTVTNARYNRVLDMRVIGNGASASSEQSTTSGIYLPGTNNHVERCTAADNNGHGIYAGDSSLVVDNTAYNNGGSIGIYGGKGSTLSGNTSYNHFGLYAIYGDTGATIADNTAYANQHWGINGTNATSIRNNTITFNNLSATADEGGLLLVNDSRVIGNTLDQNTNNNIYVEGTDNVIKDNLVTDSTNGIFFGVIGNYYADNLSANNSNAFVNTAGNTDGGGNAEF